MKIQQSIVHQVLIMNEKSNCFFVHKLLRNIDLVLQLALFPHFFHYFNFVIQFFFYIWNVLKCFYIFACFFKLFNYYFLNINLNVRVFILSQYDFFCTIYLIFHFLLSNYYCFLIGCLYFFCPSPIYCSILFHSLALFYFLSDFFAL